MDSKINFRIEYETRQIRHLAVQCPQCKKWFRGYDIVEEHDDLESDYALLYASFYCPLCEDEFMVDGKWNNMSIEEVAYPEVYNECLNKEVKWV